MAMEVMAWNGGVGGDGFLVFLLVVVVVLSVFFFFLGFRTMAMEAICW